MCKLFPSICKPRNIGDSEEFLQSSPCPHLIFTGLIRSPHSWFNQWMSLFRVKISLHGLHRPGFTSRCPPMAIGSRKKRFGHVEIERIWTAHIQDGSQSIMVKCVRQKHKRHMQPANVKQNMQIHHQSMEWT